MTKGPREEAEWRKLCAATLLHTHMQLSRVLVPPTSSVILRSILAGTSRDTTSDFVKQLQFSVNESTAIRLSHTMPFL